MIDPAKQIFSETRKDALKKSVQRLRLSVIKRWAPEAVYPDDPFRQILIDPWLIRFVLSRAEEIDFPGYVKKNRRGHLNRHYTAGFVVGGTWHCHAIPYRPEASLLYQAMAARFRGEKGWEDTEFFQDVMERVRRGEPTWNRCRSAEDVIRQCRNTDRLIESVKHHGIAMTRKPIIVSIGPRGEYIKSGNGRHRIILGLVTGVRIPVQINLRHADYVKSHLATRGRPRFSERIPVGKARGLGFPEEANHQPGRLFE